MRHYARLAIVSIFVLLPILICLTGTTTAAAPIASNPDECPSGHYYTVYDQGNSRAVIFTTGFNVFIGDQYQTQDDRLYQVVSINSSEWTALARFVEQVKLPDATTSFIAGLNVAAPKTTSKNVTVGIYSTHSDESYVPTDGTSSIRGNGGIYKVGEALAASLKQAGATVINSAQRHDPHDTAAYTRSRRTAQDLLSQGPTALLDVHRDAGGGPEAYAATVSGENVAQVRLVVGQQNPNMSSNKQFAQEIKAATDKQYPGLIKGIFFAHGGYNQDLNPRNLLLEIGTDTSTQADAEKGASFFAKAYSSYLGAKTAASQAGQTRESRVGSSTAGWLIALVIVGAGVFLLISTGGWGEMSSKLKTFTTKEFSNSLGTARRPRGKKKGPGRKS